jgi:antitoxin YefM
MTTVPFSEAETHLAELADRVEGHHELITVIRNDRPAFVLVPTEYLESIEETLDILRDPELMESIRQARAEDEAGLATPLERA